MPSEDENHALTISLYDRKHISDFKEIFTNNKLPFKYTITEEDIVHIFSGILLGSEKE